MYSHVLRALFQMNSAAMQYLPSHQFFIKHSCSTHGIKLHELDATNAKQQHVAFNTQ